MYHRTAGFESNRTNHYSNSSLHQQQHRVPYHSQRPLTDNMDNSGHFGHDTTMDMTNYNRDNSQERSGSGDRRGLKNSFDIKSKLLDEKEKRLTIQETLTKTREEQFLYKKEIDALKTELRKRPQISTMDRKVASQEDVDEIQRQLDLVIDDNVSLKLKISDLETELIDEKHQKRINYDVTLEGIKASV